MHSGRIVFSKSMDDLPHIVVFDMPKLLANRTPVSQSRSLNTFTPPPALPGSPVFPVDGGNRAPFDRC